MTVKFVRVETSTTYRAAQGGRRYLTKKAAYMAAAKKELFPDGCKCEGSDYESAYPGFTCDYHTGNSDQQLRIRAAQMENADLQESSQQ